MRRSEGGVGPGGVRFENGYMCHGRAFDWSYRSKALVLEHDCKVKNAKFQKENAKNAAGAMAKAAGGILKTGRLRRRRRSSGTRGWPSYSGVDSYFASPVYETHDDIVKYNSASYIPMDSISLTAAKTAHDAACAAFDKDLKDFYKAREKCDKALKKMKPKCEKSERGYEYKFTKSDDAGWDNVKEKCKTEKFGEMQDESKYIKAGLPSSKGQEKDEEKWKKMEEEADAARKEANKVFEKGLGLGDLASG